MSELTEFECNKVANSLFDWSISKSTVIEEVERWPLKDYVSWKLPIPFVRIEHPERNRAFRAFCVERLICKMLTVSSMLNEVIHSRDFLKAYSIISSPNLWNSEAGVIFSAEKWDHILFRNVETENYIEKTVLGQRTILEDFGVFMPVGVSSMFFTRQIEDREDKESYLGGFHALWVA